MMKFNTFLAALFSGLLVALQASAEWEVVSKNDAGKITLKDKFIGGVTNEKAPSGLPDGLIARANSGNVRQAWYAAPTTRYGHGIMGDAIEAGRLIVRDAAGSQYGFVLPRRFVFEDRYPRLADLDGDGTSEIITILTDSRAGAAIAIYALINGRIQKVAQTPHIGTPNRWRNVAGIADYDGDGQLEIAEVVTPHIGGRLNIWRYTGGGMRRLKSASGFSNHFIGSRDLELSASTDMNDNGIPDIALPNASRIALRLMDGKNLRSLDTIDMPGRISGDIQLGSDKNGPVFVVPVDQEGEFVVRRKP